MIKTIFISHVSEDKTRLKGYTDRLLREGFDLWIDSPEEICETYRAHPHIFRIGLGEDWRTAIETGVDCSDCVLAFWSKRAVEKDKTGTAEVFIYEIDRGRVGRKCLQVYLDPKRETKVRSPFANDQMADVSQLGLAGDENAFDSTISAIRMARFPSDPNAASVPRDLLPYLANRDTQTIRISAEVRERLRLEIGSDSSESQTPKFSLFPPLSRTLRICSCTVFAARTAQTNAV